MSEPRPQPKGGGQPGNRNALRHGRYSFTVGTWPRGSSYVSRAGKAMRGHLEDAVAERSGGEVSLYHAALIQSATRHEMRALLLQRELRLAGEDRETETTERQGDTSGANGKKLKAKIRTERQTGLSAMERLQLLKEIGAASDARDRCMKALGLDKSPQELRSAWDAIYFPPQERTDAADAESHSHQQQNAADGDSGDVAPMRTAAEVDQIIKRERDR